MILVPYHAGGDGTFEFVFKNTGKEPLVLSKCAFILWLYGTGMAQRTH